MNIKTVARWFFRAAALILVAGLAVINFRLYSTQGAHIEPGAPVNPGVEAQLRFIRIAIENGADADMQKLFPEGRFFMNCLYGLASVEAGLREPADSGKRRDSLAQARWALSRVASPENRAVFNPRLQPAYGVFYAGWSAVLHAGVVALQGTGDRDRAECESFQRRCAELAACFDSSATPYLQAYEGEAWSCDSAPAIFALYACDRMFPPIYGPVIERWAGRVRLLLDPTTGLPGHRVSPRSGVLIDGPRATSTCITVRFLAEATPALCAGLYDAFRRNMMTTRFGLPGVSEYPAGVGGAGDVDSGPLILGISASASAVTIGAARVMGDTEAVRHMVPTAEALGLPFTWKGRKRYVGGLLPIADAFLVWSQTAKPWFGKPSQTDWKPFVPAGWRLPMHLVSFAGAFTLFFAMFRRKASARTCPAMPRESPL